jgi:hypothetical protein
VDAPGQNFAPLDCAHVHARTRTLALITHTHQTLHYVLQEERNLAGLYAEFPNRYVILITVLFVLVEGQHIGVLARVYSLLGHD